MASKDTAEIKIADHLDEREAAPAPPTTAQQPDYERVRIVDIRITGDGDRKKAPATIFQQAIRVAPWCVGTLFFMSMSLNIVTMRMPDPRTNPQLPDLGFELFSPPMDVAHYTDAMLSTFLFSTFGVILRLIWEQYTAVRYCIDKGYIRGPKKLGVNWETLEILFETKYEIVDDDLKKEIPYADSLGGKHWNSGFYAIIKFSTAYGLSTLGRVTSILLTSLPTPNNHCIHKPHIEHWFWNGLKGFYTFGTGNKHCGDLLYSGHSILFFANFMIFWKWGPRIHWVLPFVGLFLMLFSWCMILASRSHYSDDILFAVYCTWSIWMLTKKHLPRFMMYMLFPLSAKRPIQAE